MTRSSDACERLAGTRGQLRKALLEARGPSAPPVGVDPTGWLGRLGARLRAMPATRSLVQRWDDWLAQSPVPAAGRMALQALDALLKPVARDHPWRLVLGVAALTSLLVWRSPWRRLVSPALLFALVPHGLNALAGKTPRPWWMALAGALIHRQRNPHRTI